ncbi:hypothetical protein L9F63_010608, partial [Diploptera punctata]
YVEKEWKERGIGIMKLLHNQKTGKVRALMRREQVLKICANHYLRSDMELTRMGDRAWMWVAVDFADEEMRVEKLCLRFKTSDDAANFKEAFDKGKSIVALNEMSPVKCSIGTPSSKTMSLAPEFSTTTVKVTSATTTTSPNTSKITVGGFTFASPPTFKVDSKTNAVQSSKDTTKDKEKGAGEAGKPSPFAGFSFTTPPKTSASADSVVVTSTDSVAESAPFRRPRTTLPKPVISSPATATVTVSTPQKSETEILQNTESKLSGISSSELMFAPSNPNLTFSAVAASSETTGFKIDKGFKGFEGAGKAVFGATKSFEGAGKGVGDTKHTEQENENEGVADDFIPTAEFKPVIPLPELVELKTGEEEENVLYEERSKLLRFDSEGKQWKERGIGKIKLMQHPTTGKVRLLMRREQVFKVCCNHFVSKDMKFSKLSTSDRAWSWYAQDYSEGEVKPELFALKFKTPEQALAFKQVIDKVQDKMNEKRSSVAEQTKSPQPSAWKCENCLFPNALNASHCISCLKSRPRQLKEIPVFVSRGIDQQPKLMEISKSANAWVCQSCHFKNDDDDENCAECGRPNSSKASLSLNSSETKHLSEMFKPKSGSWECKTCLIRNDGTTEVCVACESPKPGSKAIPKASTPISNFSFGITNSSTKDVPLSELFKPKQGSWECNGCYTRNDADKFVCVTSGSDFSLGPTQGISGQNEFVFGIKPSGSIGSDGIKFNFGIPTSTVTTSSSVSSLFTPSTTNKSGFTFGSATTVSTATTIFSTDSKSTSKPFSFEPRTSSGTFLFGNTTNGIASNTSSLTFSFGSTTTQSNATSNADSSDHKFTFGSPGKFEFSFSGVRPKSPVKSPKSPGVSAHADDDDESGSEPEEDEGEHIYFQPVIPLPDKVPLHTGEEEEDLLYSHRAKLYRFTGGEWKERGVGDIKVLKHHTTKKVRLLMRREQVLKLCLNHFLNPEQQFREKDEKSWLWSAKDFSEGQLQEEKFAIRFKNKDIAMEFKEAIDKAQADMTSMPGQDTIEIASVSSSAKVETTAAEEIGAGPVNSTPAMKNFSFTLPTVSTNAQETQSSSSSSFSLSSRFGGSSTAGCARTLFGGSPVQKSISGVDLKSEKDEVEVLYELKVTPEEEAAAAQLKLPLNFYSYLRKPPCPGCSGCEPESGCESENVAKESSIMSSKSSVLAQQLTPTTTASSTTTTQSNEKQAPIISVQTSVISTKSISSTAESLLPQFSTITVSSGTPFGYEAHLNQSQSNLQTSSGSSTTDTTSQVQSSIFSQPKASPLIAAPKLKVNTIPQTTVSSIFTQPQSTKTTFQEGTPNFGQNCITLTSKPSITGSTSFFGQPTTQNTSFFSSIDSTPKSTSSSNFTALGSKSSQVSTTASETSKPTFVFSVGSKPQIELDTPKSQSFDFGTTLDLKPVATLSSDAEVTSSSGFSNSTPVTSIKSAGFTFGATSTEHKDTTDSAQPKEARGVPFLPFDSNLSFSNLAMKSEQGFKTGISKFMIPGF